MTGRAFRDASEPDEGSMTNPGEVLIEAGEFLIVRLREFDSTLTDDGESAREYFGHVTPAIARFENALQQAAAPVQKDACPIPGCGGIMAPEPYGHMPYCLKCQTCFPETAAPVQDDDAEIALIVEVLRKHEGSPHYGDTAKEILARLIPDRVTPLVEALTIAVAALGRVNVRCFDDPKSPLKPIGDIAREGLSRIAETIGDKAYDEIAMEADYA